MDLKSLYLLNTHVVTCRAVGLCGSRNSLLVLFESSKSHFLIPSPPLNWMDMEWFHQKVHFAEVIRRHFPQQIITPQVNMMIRRITKEYQRDGAGVDLEVVTDCGHTLNRKTKVGKDESCGMEDV